MSKEAARGRAITAGGAIFARLKALGVDYVFANSGTDFPPVIEGLAEAAAKDIALPSAVVVPHEHAAMSMAHGYYLATGRAQSVMLHTNVGLGNAVTGAINAACAQVPVLLMSGRTPTTERGRFGCRTVPIGWGQEMRDQTALMREVSKWDYELRFPEQIVEVLDRGHAIANSTPKGPIYISLPREVLCEPCGEDLDDPIVMRPAPLAPNPALLAEAAAILAAAERPLIVIQSGAGSAAGFEALGRLAEDWAFPVSEYWANAKAISEHHPMCVGDDREPWLSEADAILVIDSLAPWEPARNQPRAEAKVVQMGPDPLQSRFPVRNFRADLAIACETDLGIIALAEALAPLRAAARGRIEARRPGIVARVTERLRRDRADAAVPASPHLTRAHVSQVLGEAIRGRKATVVGERGCELQPLELTEHGSWYDAPYSGGLGWGLGCALGIKLADRERLVVATVGDGSYMFANPTVCHQVAEALELPVVVLVINNGEWAAVRQSVGGLYPGGYAAKANVMPLTSLQPVPDFTMTARASRAHVERVERAEDLRAALDRAIRAATEDKRQALVDIIVAD